MTAAMSLLFSTTCLANTIFIGDSRTVGMYDALHGTSTANSTNLLREDADGTVWSCKVGMGLKWMKETGIPQIEGYITEDSNVVVLMGVNDIADTFMADRYLMYLDTKAKEWTEKGANVYYASVMPLKYDKGYETNEKIGLWNEILKIGLQNAEYIDMDDSVDYDFSDMYHYKSHTSLDIYNYLNDYVGQEA